MLKWNSRHVPETAAGVKLWLCGQILGFFSFLNPSYTIPKGYKRNFLCVCVFLQNNFKNLFEKFPTMAFRELRKCYIKYCKSHYIFFFFNVDYCILFIVSIAWFLKPSFKIFFFCCMCIRLLMCTFIVARYDFLFISCLGWILMRWIQAFIMKRGLLRWERERAR